MELAEHWHVMSCVMSLAIRPCDGEQGSVLHGVNIEVGVQCLSLMAPSSKTGPSFEKVKLASALRYGQLGEHCHPEDIGMGIWTTTRG